MPSTRRCEAPGATRTAISRVLAPAFQTTRHDLIEQLRGAGTAVGQSFRGERLRAALVVGEVALSVVLLAGAGLLVRSYVNIQRVDQVIARLQGVPGVSAAAAASFAPLGGGIRSGIDVAGRPHEETYPTLVQLSTASYFPTTGQRLLRGRLFSDDEVAAGRQVAVVNEALARRHFGENDPVGRQITVTDPVGVLRRGGLENPTFEVVGGVADMKNRGPREASWPEAFLPLSLATAHGRVFLVRAGNETTRLANSIRAEIWAVDRNLVIEETAAVAGILEQYHYAEPRFSLAVLSALTRSTRGLIRSRLPRRPRNSG